VENIFSTQETFKLLKMISDSWSWIVFTFLDSSFLERGQNIRPTPLLLLLFLP